MNGMRDMDKIKCYACGDPAVTIKELCGRAVRASLAASEDDCPAVPKPVCMGCGLEIHFNTVTTRMNLNSGTGGGRRVIEKPGGL